MLSNNPVKLGTIALVALASSVVFSLACGGPKQPTFPIVPTQPLVQQGKAIYNASCLMCHGDERGKGRQFGAPPHNSEGHTWHHPDRLLFEWVMEGLPLRRAMPAFRGQLTEQQVIAVLAYIKTMWPNEIRQWQLEGSRRYEEQVKKFPPPTLPR